MGTAEIHVGNRAPIAGDDSVRATPRGSLHAYVLGNDSDPDGDALGVEAGTITTEAGALVTFEPEGFIRYRAPRRTGATTASSTWSSTITVGAMSAR